MFEPGVCLKSRTLCKFKHKNGTRKQDRTQYNIAFKLIDFHCSLFYHIEIGVWAQFSLFFLSIMHILYIFVMLCYSRVCSVTEKARIFLMEQSQIDLYMMDLISIYMQFGHDNEYLFIQFGILPRSFFVFQPDSIHILADVLECFGIDLIWIFCTHARASFFFSPVFFFLFLF